MADGAAHDASGGQDDRRRGVIAGVVGRVAPTVMRTIDMDAIIAELDVDAIAAQLDLDALMARLDMDALVEQLDVNAVAAKLDLDALMARLDMDALVEQLDVDAVAEKLDLDALMRRIDMAQLTAGATQDVALSGLDLFRRQLVRIDRTVERSADRILRRTPDARPEAPGHLDVTIPVALEEPDPDEDAPAAEASRRRSVSGHYAGPVTRILALAGDITAAVSTFGFIGAISLFLLSTFIGVDLTEGSDGWIHLALLAVWMLAWFWLPVALFGRTLAMALVGLAVVKRDGSIASSRRGLVRALVLPISLAILGLGLLGIVIGRERRALHDVAAGTVVVYDWGSREAEQPATIREQLQARVRRRQPGSPEPG